MNFSRVLTCWLKVSDFCRSKEGERKVKGKKPQQTQKEEDETKFAIEFFNDRNFTEFNSIFPELVSALTMTNVTAGEEGPGGEPVFWIKNWLRRAINENCPNGKKLRGLMTFVSFKALALPCEKTEKNLWGAKIVGWCIEFLQAYALILDDIMDKSVTRRGKPCWYLNPTVGVAGAIVDASMIHESIYILLHKEFYDNPMLTSKLVHTFHKMTETTWRGQSLDSRLDFRKEPEKFTMDTYRTIAKLKCSFYSFYYPVIFGMILANFEDLELIDRVGDILLRIGHLFQVQDDFLDCFGDVKRTQKEGTDIQDGKCSWLLVSALKMADPDQLNVLKKNIGSSHKKNVGRVKKVYQRLELDRKFKQFEHQEFQEISLLIDEIAHPALKKLLAEILNLNYKRQR